MRFSIVVIFLLIAGAALAQQDSHARAAQLRAQAHMAAGNWPQAVAELEALADKFPGERYILGDLATAYGELGARDAAIDIYFQLYRRYGDYVIYRDNLVYLLAAQRRYGELVEVLQDVQPLPDEFLPLLATAYDQTGRSALAEELYQRMSTRGDVKALVLLGERYLGRQEKDKAAVYLDQARALAPRDGRILKSLALALNEADPARYRLLLLDVYTLDKTDPEVAYLLGEDLAAESAEQAARFYRATLQRLDALEDPSLYQRRMRGQALYKLGEKEAAETHYRQLMARDPGAVEPVADLAELLFAERRYDEVLTLVPAPNGGVRAMQMRAAVYLERGQWAAAVAELRPLSARDTSDVDLHLDLAAALARTGQWREALAICDSALFARAPRAAAERAFELRLPLRQRRGSIAVIEGTHTGLTGEEQWGLRPRLRHYFNERLYGLLRLTGGHYAVDQLAAGGGFSQTLGELGLEMGYAVRPDLDLAVRARGYSDALKGGGLKKTINLGANALWQWGRSGRLEADASRGNLWSEPVSAVALRGLFDELRLAATGARAGFYAQVEGRWRDYYLHRDQSYGDELRVVAFLGRELWRRAYASPLALRSLGISIAHEHLRGHSAARFARDVPLQDEVNATTLNLFAHFLPSRRAFVDLSLYSGWDPRRDLGLGDLIGASVDMHVDLTARVALYLNAAYATESSVRSGGGHYRQATLGALRSI